MDNRIATVITVLIFFVVVGAIVGFAVKFGG
jgi:hypothetical protein